jgi:pimeloyl-ACP methyl ester carboxylesterase
MSDMENILHWILLILFFILFGLLILSLGLVLLKSVGIILRAIFKKTNVSQLKHLKTTCIWTFYIVVGVIAVSLLSQLTASTPSIDGENAIAELIKVDLNGESHWINIRGVDQNADVLLFLAGGPGGSQLAAVRHELPELESEFVVVGWDQPGSAKTFNLGKNLEVTDYIKDGLALTEYLCERFDKEKIYIVGESWGSALGVMMASERPERFHALVSAAQMVDFLETELIDYSKALELSTLKGDTDKMIKLLENGAPPYFGDDVTWKIAEYISYLGHEMDNNPKISNSGYDTLRDIFSTEYGIIDKINYVRGIIQTFNRIYPQLYDMDLRVSYRTLHVPIKFIIGRHDINAPSELSEDYFSKLSAPSKEWVWFENSGHSPWINEADKFVDEIIKMKNLQF